MMSTLKKALLILSLIPLFCFSNDNKWLHLYRNSVNFFSIPIRDISDIHHSIDESGDDIMSIAHADQVTLVPIDDINRCEIGENVPTIRIDIPSDPKLRDLVDKETYLDAVISIDGAGKFDDVKSLPVRIKGRGNTTWNYPKKPYRLKFDKKVSLLGFENQKNFALIANYIDCSNMRNAIAFEIAHLLQMPFTNHVQPVRLYFNGRFRGAYFVTEKIGISKGSVDIDEDAGVLFELDRNYDEAYKFRSPLYNLPVMIKDPDLDEIAEKSGIAAEVLLKNWEEQFVLFEKAVAKGTFTEMVDMQSLVNFVLVYNLCGNREICWPKSLFVYREHIDDVYHFGPVWDFDWAFTYDSGAEDKSPTDALIISGSSFVGGQFLRKLCKNDTFRVLFSQTWDDFVANKYPLLLDYIEYYAQMIEPSTIENGTIWGDVPGKTTSSFRFDDNKNAILEWLDRRVAFISQDPNFGL